MAPRHCYARAVPFRCSMEEPTMDELASQGQEMSENPLLVHSEAWRELENFFYIIGDAHFKPHTDDAPIPPVRLAYEVAKSMYLIRKDYNRRFSVLGNEGRKLAENCFMLILLSLIHI